MSERTSDLSVEMRTFSSLPIAKPFLIRFWTLLVIYEVVILFLLRMLLGLVMPAMLALLLASAAGVLGGLLMYRNSPMLNVPLAVNINHPFMSDAELGHASVMVRFSDGTWGDIGAGRVRMTPDEMIGGSMLIRDNDEYTVIGHFSEKETSHTSLKRYVILINQAIALRDAVNGDEDTFEEARHREHIDYGLLERSWLEVDENLEIEPDGIFSKLRRE